MSLWKTYEVFIYLFLLFSVLGVFECMNVLVSLGKMGEGDTHYNGAQ